MGGRREFLDVVIEFNMRMAVPLRPRSVPSTPRTAGHRPVRRLGRRHRRQAVRRHLHLVHVCSGPGAIVEAIAFFDTIEFTDLWTRVTGAPAEIWW
jgi:hypothetical protein